MKNTRPQKVDWEAIALAALAAITATVIYLAPEVPDFFI